MDLVAVAPRIPVVGETITGTGYFTFPGGKGANQAYAAALLGGNVSVLGCVGDDEFGAQMRVSLERAGCNVRGVGVQSGPSGVALIFVDENGQNSIIIVPGANRFFTPEQVLSCGDHMRGAKIVLLQLETPLSTVLTLARAARQAGAIVILDPAPATPAPLELLKLVDILTPNETEAAILTRRSPGDLEPKDAAAIGADLVRMGVRTAVMKLGRRGCVIVDAGAPRLIAAPKVNVVDTTGAGDVFNAGLAVSLGEGSDLCTACRFANFAAALSVTQHGARGAVPTRAVVDELMKSGQIGP